MQIVRQFTERLSNVKAAKRADQKSAVAQPQGPQPLDATQLRQVGGGLRVPAPKTTW